MKRLRASVELALVALGSIVTTGCGTPPPKSPMPNARAAIDRLHASQNCGLGIQASAKIDHFGAQGRVRGELLLFAVSPARLRMDIVGPMNVGVVATLASDGNKFALADLREKRFFFGPAKACNIARLTTVPMPGHVLVSLLRGEAPILKHTPEHATIAWSRSGYYVVTISSSQNAVEELHLEPHPSDRDLPWEKQRLRLVDVEVRQQGYVLYHAELGDHRNAAMSKPRLDPDGIDAPIPVIGPVCTAELPKKISVEVPSKRADIEFRYEDVAWNPPLVDGLFDVLPQPGLQPQRVDCADE